jgi:hypothetical protein
MKRWRMVLVAGVLFCGVGAAQPARAGFLEDAGWGSLTVLTNLVYMPVKLTYAVLGGLTGGLTYMCSAGNLETAETVWKTSMGGTYAVTPRMLQGEDPIAFAGTPSTDTTADSGQHPTEPPQETSNLKGSGTLHEEGIVQR